MSESSIEKNDGAAYEICVADKRHQIILIESGQVEGHCWGRLVSHGDYGRFAAYWGSCGVEFSQFLTKIDFDYAMEKMTDGDYMEFDPCGTALASRKRIACDRRNREVTKQQARNWWDEFNLIALRDNKDDANEVFRNLNVELWDRVEYQYLPRQNCTDFWREVWPLLAEELNKEAP